MTTTLIIRNYFPHEVSTKVGQVFLKGLAKKLPPYMKRVEVYTEPRRGEMSGYAIYDVEDGKVGDAIRELTNRQILYHEVPGYRWRIAIVLKAAESLGLLGLTPPPK